MVINTKSWHYRFLCWASPGDTMKYDAPKDLCSYGQRVIGLAVFWSVLSLAVLICALGILALCFRYPITMLCIGAVIVPPLAIIKLGGWRKLRERPTMKLIGEWVAAKKAGVCPIITYSNDDSH